MHVVSVLGRVYLLAVVSLLILGVLWGTLTMLDNRSTVEIVLLVPRLDFVEPFSRQRYLVDTGNLMAGWGIAMGVLLLLAIRAPFRVRMAAVSQRRVRDLEREVLELRRLPLRQQEEDDILAAEAPIDTRAKKVMSDKVRRKKTPKGPGPLPKTAPPGLERR